MLLPEVMSWKGLLEREVVGGNIAASEYRLGLMLPTRLPGPFFCNNKAKTPAKVGGPTEVPPVTSRDWSARRNPLTQEPSLQIR